MWNCRGALKPSFQKYVRELVHSHNPSILVVMETRIGGERAKEITDRLPFDGVYHTETIGCSGGLWMLWNSERFPLPIANEKYRGKVQSRDKMVLTTRLVK